MSLFCYQGGIYLIKNTGKNIIGKLYYNFKNFLFFYTYLFHFI